MTSTNEENKVLCRKLEESLTLAQKSAINHNISINISDSTVNGTVKENTDSIDNHFTSTIDEAVTDDVDSTKAECSDTEYNDDSPSDCDEYEDASEYQENWSNQLHSVKERTSLSSLSNFDDSSESDWEDEKLHNPRTFGKIYKHPAKSDMIAFVPSDLHATLISAQAEVWHCVEEGQFDDADL